MAILSIENVSFSFPNEDKTVLNDINLFISQGDFTVIAGKSGSGKSTLLQLIKSEIAPHGQMSGKIAFQNERLDTIDSFTLAKAIGFVFQDPENQIVMDTVIDELSFGMENFQYTVDEMHKKIAEIVHFFDINHLVNRKTDRLSGGEKQLINLASVLLLEPQILLLDEPLAQLDPITAKSFIRTLQQLNEELGLTIILVEHNLDDLLQVADQLIILDDGKVEYNATPHQVIYHMLQDDSLVNFLPDSTRLYHHFESQIKEEAIPITVNETKQWLLNKRMNVCAKEVVQMEVKPFLQLKHIDFQYVRHGEMIIDNLNLSINKGEWLTVVGANGSGKSTLMKLIVGVLRQQHGHFVYDSKKTKKLDNHILGYLPQSPKLVFIQDTIKEELRVIAARYHVTEDELIHLIEMFQLKSLLQQHPFDLSGGELQRAALLATVLTKPEVLILDEPTKGIDPVMKETLGELLLQLQTDGMTIVMVTHDIEFAAKYSTRSGLLFQGELVALSMVDDFFNGNAYYTTMMNRITRQSSLPVVTTLEKAVQLWQIQE